MTANTRPQFGLQETFLVLGSVGVCFSVFRRLVEAGSDPIMAAVGLVLSSASAYVLIAGLREIRREVSAFRIVFGVILLLAVVSGTFLLAFHAFTCTPLGTTGC